MLQKNPLAPPIVVLSAIPLSAMQSIADRERVSDWYWTRKDNLTGMRVWWRAATARHMLHLLPGETILELGCGTGMLTRALEDVSRRECPITAATFDPANDLSWCSNSLQSTEGVRLSGFPGELGGRQFDYVIASNVLDHACSVPLLTEVQKLLKPGGRLLFFETNPWNPVFQMRRRLGKLLPFIRRGDERLMHNRVQLYELLSELGFVSIATTCYDFLYPPVPQWSLPVTRTLSSIDGNHATDQAAGRNDPPTRAETAARSPQAFGALDRAPYPPRGHLGRRALLQRRNESRPTRRRAAKAL